MDVILAFIIFAGSMIFVLFRGLPMTLAMCAGFVVFVLVGVKRGFKIIDLLKMSLAGAKDSLIVVRVMLTIGILTGLWRSAGTFAILTAWGLRLITPNMFILAAFALSCVLSYALGTSFGTAGTLGVALMTLARSGGVSEILTAGAIMSGIHFGDRGSPASSCAHLVTSLTGTNFYKNIKLMMKVALLPLAISLCFYFALSLKNPLASLNTLSTLDGLAKGFNLSIWAISPAVLMLILPAFKINIFYAFLLSIVTAFICSVTLQGESVVSAFECALFGLHATDGVRVLFNGGGLISMINLCLVLVISGTYAGIFEGTKMLESLQSNIAKLIVKIGTFQATLLVGILSNSIFCNQTVGVIMTNQLMKRPYEQYGLTNTELALDISNSTVITAPLIPWCIACSVALAMLEAPVESLKYSCYLYLLPLFYAITRKRWLKVIENS